MHEFQAINLYIDDKDKLYLFGVGITSHHDKCWLYKLKTTINNQEITDVTGATEVAYKHLKRNGKGPRLKWGGCVYFHPDSNNAQSGDTVSGRLKIHSCEAQVVGRDVRCNEWSDGDTGTGVSWTGGIKPSERPQPIE